jgi:hypothetical protein
MAVIALTDVKAVVEADGQVRCVNCIDGEDYWKGLDPKKEILVTQEDLENPDKLYVCDCCEQTLNR